MQFVVVVKSVLSFIRRFLVVLLVAPIRFYQTVISPMTPPSCRFTPTCSEYARQAIIKHGPFKGLYLAKSNCLTYPIAACFLAT